MIEVVLFGTGNVASHLFKALRESKSVKVIQVYNHRKESLDFFKGKVEVTTSFKDLKEADLFLIAVKDDYISELASQLKPYKTLVVHTSGSLPLLSNNDRNGVFYPLQTFSKEQTIDYSAIPICIEASNPSDLKILKEVGAEISQKIYPINSEQRKSLHLASVFACNFSNALYGLAEQICQKNDVPFEILYPLILETAQKIKNNSPKTVQTGPAIRGDQKTIDFQLNQINSTEIKNLYILLTNLIQKEQ